VIIWRGERNSHDMHNISYILIHAQKVIMYLHTDNSSQRSTDVDNVNITQVSGEKVMSLDFYIYV
jgi:hypothetical protein